MEADTVEFCCGCLSSGRKMKRLNEYWTNQSFHKIFTEIPIIETESVLQLLCWECEARISNFLVFKDQVKNSCEILHQYVKKDRKSKPLSVSKLTVCTQKSIDINTNDSDELQIKNEINNTHTFSTDTEIRVKDDTKCYTYENRSLDAQNINIDDAEIKIKDDTECYSDDNRYLVEIYNEKRKLRKNKKKVDKRRTNAGKISKKKNVEFEMVTLNSEEILEERNIMKQKEEFVNSLFKCEKCIIAFANNDDLKEHDLTKHLLNASKHSCAVCERTFGSEHSLAAHVRSHSVRFQCVACQHRAATERAAHAHYRERHDEGCSEMFELAAKAYQTSDELVTDKDRTKSKELVPCEYCDKKFRWKTSLRKHLETHRIEAGHKRKPYCETCKLSFSTSSNLRKHVKTSSKHQIKLKMRKVKELPGSEAVHQAQDLVSISARINGQRERFPCPQCEKRFQWKGNLLRHLKSHAARANGDLVCEPCKRTFSSIATYKQHMNISRKHVSEDEFKYMCSDCGKRFSSKIKLRDHSDWEHLKRYTHRCECGKPFRSHTSLYLHRQVVHRAGAGHLCDHCGKAFPNKTKLASHIIALHTRDSPYKCNTCTARFSWHSCLSRHVRRVHRHVLRTNEACAS